MMHKFINSRFTIKELNDEGEFEGYASIFNIEDSDADVVMPGAFSKSMEEHQAAGTFPKLLWQHDTAQPIGVWKEIKEDQHGLYVKGKLLLEVAQAREAYALLHAGALDGLSIGYRPIKASRDPQRGVRNLDEVKLYEISIVTFPALEVARIDAVKSQKPATLREFEARLREEMGFTKTESEMIAGRGYKAFEGLRDEPSDAKSHDDLRDEVLAAIKNNSAILRK